MQLLKDLLAILLLFAIGFGLMYLVLNAPSVKRQEYRSCNITFTDKQICEDILK